MMLWLALAGCFTFDGLVVPGDPKDAYDLSSDLIPADRFEEVSFESADGAVLYGVWAHQADGVDAPPLLWIHGNGGALDLYVDRIETYWSWGYDVFAVDYRGFGKSEPEIDTERMLQDDGAAAARYVADATGVAPEDIPWVSLSLGAAVAVHGGDEVPAKGIVIENMFPSTDLIVDDATSLDFPTGWFFADVYDNVAAVRDVISPVFVVHGLADDFIDPAYAEIVHDAAPAPAWLWQPEGVGHADIHQVIPDRYRTVVTRFLDDPASDPLAASGTGD